MGESTLNLSFQTHEVLELCVVCIVQYGAEFGPRIALSMNWRSVSCTAHGSLLLDPDFVWYAADKELNTSGPLTRSQVE